MSTPRLEALPFDEAIDSFRKKGFKQTFDWRDMQKEEHAYSFTVAKAMRNDILQDVRAAMDDVIAKGQTFEEFKSGLKPQLVEKGWWGRAEMTDPQTGEKRDVQLGSTRRLRTIFDTNLRTSYSAGRWEQIQRTKKVLPFLRYVTAEDDDVRPAHRLLHNTVLPVDHPFWEKYYPPNDWGCRCFVQQVGAEDLDRLGLKLTEYDPSMPDRSVLNRRTGEILRIPQGIGPGFDYNVGKARMRALTPPALDRPLDVPYVGDPAKVPMPRASKLKDAAQLPEGMTEEEYARHFLQAFGADIGRPRVFNDVTGEPLVISDELFLGRDGKPKITKFGRNRYLPLLAAAVRAPDEIWHVWEIRENLPPVLRRRYLKRFEDGKRGGIAVFDTGKDGWSGVTTFQSKDKSYIEQQRKGALVYRRPDDEN